nr:aldo/keto reductase [uncultured Roseateles sp.]
MNTSIPLQTHLPHASRLVLGCMGLGGGWDQTPIGEADIAKAHAAVEAALEIGITLFDHADIYTRGKAEQCMGELFKRQPSLRQRLHLQSKCGIRFADASGPGRYDLSAEHIERSVDGILQRLQIESLEILMLHRPDPLMQAEEVAAAFSRLRAAGKVQHLAVSNMQAAQMRQLSASLDQPLLANQVEMSLGKLDWLEAGSCFNDAQLRPQAHALNWPETLAYCQAHHVQLQAWGSLAKGVFSGAALPGGDDAAAAAVRHCAEQVQQLANLMVVSREAIVLAWLMMHPAGIQPVIGSSEPARIRACGEALKVKLSREDWYRLYVAARGQALP